MKPADEASRTEGAMASTLGHGLFLCGAMSFLSGVVLDGVARMHRETKRLLYLSYRPEAGERVRSSWERRPG